MIPEKREKREYLLAGILILAVLLLSYRPVLQAGFLNWDDDTHLVNNPLVRVPSPGSILKIFSTAPNKTYIPLTILSFAAEYRIFGLNPFFFHLDNLILHGIVVFLLMLLFRKMGLSFEGSLIGGILFGIHPMHVESVAWVTARKDVLYSVFYLLALNSYIQYFQLNQRKFYLAAIVFSLLSVLSKPMAISLPFILLLLDWFFRRDWRKDLWLEKIPFALIVFSIGSMTYLLNARRPGEGSGVSILTFFWSFAFYLKKFFWPSDLIPLYSLPQPVSIANPEFLGALLIVTVFSLALFFFRQNRPFVFAIGFYVLSAFFLWRFDNLKDTNIVADRFMYLPSAGICFLSGVIFQNILERSKRNSSGMYMAGWIGLMVFFCFLVGKTNAQAAIWQNDFSLWNSQIKINPNHELAYNSLGAALAKQGNAQSAVENFSKAILLRPDYAKAFYNRGHTYASLGRATEALADLNRSLQLVPFYPSAYLERGMILIKTGKFSEALNDFSLAIEQEPDCAPCYNNRALAYKKMGDVQNALSDFSQAIQLNREFFPAYFNRSRLFNDSGNVSQALDDLNACASLQAQNTAVYSARAKIYFQLKDFARFNGDLEKIIQLDPKNGEAYYMKAVAGSIQGKTPVADENFRKARELGFKPPEIR